MDFKRASESAEVESFTLELEGRQEWSGVGWGGRFSDTP